MIVVLMKWFQVLSSKEMPESNNFFLCCRECSCGISPILTLMTQSLWSFGSWLSISPQFLQCSRTVAEVLMWPPLLTQAAFARLLSFSSLFNIRQTSSIVSPYYKEHISSCPSSPAWKFKDRSSTSTYTPLFGTIRIAAMLFPKKSSPSNSL